jgi:hypothetical protein
MMVKRSPGTRALAKRVQGNRRGAPANAGQHLRQRQGPAALRLGLVQRGVRRDVHEGQARQLSAQRQDLLQLRGVLHDDHLRAAVLDDEGALLRRARRVDGNGGAAAKEDADVAQNPFETGLRQQTYGVAPVDAQGGQSRGDLTGRLVGLPPCHAQPGRMCDRPVPVRHPISARCHPRPPYLYGGMGARLALDWHAAKIVVA